MYVGAWQELRLAAIVAQQAKAREEELKRQRANLDFSRLRPAPPPIRARLANGHPTATTVEWPVNGIDISEVSAASVANALVHAARRNGPGRASSAQHLNSTSRHSTTQSSQLSTQSAALLAPRLGQGAEMADLYALHAALKLEPKERKPARKLKLAKERVYLPPLPTAEQVQAAHQERVARLRRMYEMEPKQNRDVASSESRLSSNSTSATTSSDISSHFALPSLSHGDLPHYNQHPRQSMTPSPAVHSLRNGSVIPSGATPTTWASLAAATTTTTAPATSWRTHSGQSSSVVGASYAQLPPLYPHEHYKYPYPHAGSPSNISTTAQPYCRPPMNQTSSHSAVHRPLQGSEPSPFLAAPLLQQQASKVLKKLSRNPGGSGPFASRPSGARTSGSSSSAGADSATSAAEAFVDVGDIVAEATAVALAAQTRQDMLDAQVRDAQLKAKEHYGQRGLSTSPPPLPPQPPPPQRTTSVSTSVLANAPDASFQGPISSTSGEGSGGGAEEVRRKEEENDGLYEEVDTSTADVAADVEQWTDGLDELMSWEPG